MNRRTIKTWLWLHKWSGLACTLFLLMLCVTGLPLVFHDEIDTLTGSGETGLAGPASAQAGLPLDRIVARAVRDGGGGVPLFIGFSQADPLITVTVGPRPDAPGPQMRLLSYDRSSGRRIGEAPEDAVMHAILQLHTDMFLGLPGMLFLGAMGLLFVLALVSGVVLYVPFMRRLPYGTLREGRGTQVRRLDYHNLLGAVTLGWALVIGLTGAINAFADPLVDSWRSGVLARMAASYASEPALAPRDYGSIDKAMAAARAKLPGRSPQFIGFPGGAWSSPHHYAIFFQGDTPLTSHVLTPALVDARTGALTDVRAMPAINQALMLSKPLHFGDYGGLALKLAWALLDLATIWVLVTGLQLWLGRATEHRGGEPRRLAGASS